MPIQGSVHINKRSYAHVMAALKAGGEDAPGLGSARGDRSGLLGAGAKALDDLKKAQARAIKGAKTKGSRGGGAAQRERLVTGGVARDKATANRARRSRGLRNSIAATLKTQQRMFKGGKAGPGRTGASLSVRASASKMPGGARGPLGRMPKHWNYGRWRHPVFAQAGVGKGSHTGTWVQQDVESGWFDGTWAQRRKRVQDDLMKAAEQAYDINKMARRRGA